MSEWPEDPTPDWLWGKESEMHPDDLDWLRKQARPTFGQDLFRPRDEFDVDVHPESVRGKALALMDEQERVMGVILATRRGRVLWRLARLWVRLRSTRTG